MMKWMSLFRGGRKAPNTMLRRGTMMSLIALAGGAVVYGATRKSGNVFQKMLQPRKRMTQKASS